MFFFRDASTAQRHKKSLHIPDLGRQCYPRTRTNTAKGGKERLAIVTVKWVADTKDFVGILDGGIPRA
jgi:hypothetical protein